MSLITEEIRSKATEFYQGNEICKAQCKRLLLEKGLPNGLLPLEDVLECGHIEETGFVWMKQKKEIKHKFEKIGRKVCYGTEVTAYVEQCKIKKLTGVKAKELMMWLTLTDITMDSPESKEIVFKTTTGLYRTFPTDAFVVEEAVGDEKVVKSDGNVVGAKEVEVVANVAKEN